MSHDQPPTNQPPTASYTSVRITIPHVQHDQLCTVLDGCQPYILYPHTGITTSKEHFHVVFSDTSRTTIERLRKRLKTKFGLSGNGDYSIKQMHNGILSGIQYISKEKTKYFF